MSLFQRWFGTSEHPTINLEGTEYMFSKSRDFTIPMELIARELSEIRKGVSGIQSDIADVRTDVSALSQDVKGLGSTQHRHETWLTKIDGDVIALRGFPQKIEAVEKAVVRLESEFDKQKNTISDLRNFQTSETAIDATKKAGLSRFQAFLTIVSIFISMGSTILLAIVWILSRLPPT
jgi:archaellum component FlaC